MYLITGASGGLAQTAAELLLESVPADQVILTTRAPGKLQSFADRGVHVRYADFADPVGLEAAFEGAERMLLVSTAQVGTRIGLHRNAIDAARRAGVRYLAYTSIVGAGTVDNDAVVCLEHRATEEILRESGLRWNALRDAQYAQAVAYFIAPGAVAMGSMVGAWGEGTVGFVSREDCAASAVGALLGRGEDDRAYEITGPEELSYRQVCALIAEISGADIAYVPISDEEQYAIFDSMGVPREYDEEAIAASPIPWNSDDMVSFSRAIRLGHMSSLSDAVQILAGRAPRSIRSVLEEAAATWPPAAPPADATETVVEAAR
ncbi:MULTISPECIES: NAD(P)H-binding protein [Streptomyces]|uniref:NAD(P)H-binding protein n=1 Tax=Streptomyces caniscabiei TaxID=2746961 RepID=A0ABU4MYS9_9ACTN|nr:MULTISPECIES: NAD(P)H-binding protein [Streptomyces]MDX2947420.1 NAD(P)H-binding protein [Streptomyces caniscabiei]MDX2956826.1 NAD(P)H-binding protein [Streptomyces caniscabiei]MDX2990590.1 NAD(P)H-binding protein [Streptomyces caniscabiei]MDX3014784.1 NAD(P)H-binding protein [Streptomyces caniscabiei]MDX3041969.1 NAD(P)H-binding protein [Streptomyces caniscabiei]